MNDKNPQSREEILSALEKLRDDGLNFWTQLDSDRFATSFGEAWSPSDNVRHLIKSTQPVTKALKLPKLMLQSLFGTAKEPSMSYEALIVKYQGLLAEGGNAGKFAPDAAEVPDDHAEWQRNIVGRCRESVRDLEQAAASLTEKDLDRYRLPHPLLGKLTLREMLFFTLYHFDHHKQNVVRRMNEAGQSQNPER